MPRPVARRAVLPPASGAAGLGSYGNTYTCFHLGFALFRPRMSSVLEPRAVNCEHLPGAVHVELEDVDRGAGVKGRLSPNILGDPVTVLKVAALRNVCIYLMDVPQFLEHTEQCLGPRSQKDGLTSHTGCPSPPSMHSRATCWKRLKCERSKVIFTPESRKLHHLNHTQSIKPGEVGLLIVIESMI